MDLLLDVDGVLNPCPFSIDRSSEWIFEQPFKSTKASGGFTLNLSREMGKAIEELDYNIRWLTTWAHHAHVNIGMHFDWISHQVLAEPPEASYNMYGCTSSDWLWKPRAVMEFVKDPGDKVVWIDDDANEFIDHFDKNGLTLDPHERLLIISPITDVGLTKSDLGRIREFLR